MNLNPGLNFWDGTLLCAGGCFGILLTIRHGRRVWTCRPETYRDWLAKRRSKIWHKLPFGSALWKEASNRPATLLWQARLFSILAFILFSWGVAAGIRIMIEYRF